LLLIVYLAIGAVIANNHHYFAHLHGWQAIVSLVLAVLLWPLVLLGVDLHIHVASAVHHGGKHKKG
jgi:hypothetical protein